MSAFQRVGEQVAYGETLVQLADVEPLRRLCAQGLMLAARSIKSGWSEDMDVVSYAHYFNSNFEPGVRDKFLSIQTANSSSPDFWRLGISCRTLSDDERHSNKRVHYRLEGTAGELLQAKREIYLVRGLAQIAFVDGAPVERVTSIRRVHERHMDQIDCDKVLTTLNNAQNRLQVA